MEMIDYETGRDLVDVGITLTREEALDMVAFLSHLLREPEVKRAYISDVRGFCLEREITLSLREGSYAETA